MSRNRNTLPLRVEMVYNKRADQGRFVNLWKGDHLVATVYFTDPDKLKEAAAAFMKAGEEWWYELYDDM